VVLLLGGVFNHRRRKNKKFEFLDALAAPTQKEHSRAMLPEMRVLRWGTYVVVGWWVRIVPGLVVPVSNYTMGLK
jgi:hypothetical protein